MPTIQPSLRDLCNSKLTPALKRRAIFTMSLRDRSISRGQANFPKALALGRWVGNSAPEGCIYVDCLVARVIPAGQRCFRFWPVFLKVPTWVDWQIANPDPGSTNTKDCHRPPGRRFRSPRCQPQPNRHGCPTGPGTLWSAKSLL